MQQGREPSLAITSGCLVHPHEIQRQDLPALGPDLCFPLQVPLGLVPSLHRFVSFAASQVLWTSPTPDLSSACRSGCPSRQRPPRRKRHGSRSGLLCSEDDLSYVKRTSTPAERGRLA